LMLVLISTLLAWLVNPVFDAIGSISVGLLLLAVSILLIAEVKNLIVGESMPRQRRQLMRNVIHKYRNIGHINRMQTMVMGDSQYLVLLSVDINDEMKGSALEDMTERLKLELKKEIPEIGTIYIEAQDSARNQQV
jgi:divalent metal cation (Fe/Co/Zn/Cd) transporter